MSPFMCFPDVSFLKSFLTMAAPPSACILREKEALELDLKRSELHPNCLATNLVHHNHVIPFMWVAGKFFLTNGTFKWPLSLKTEISKELIWLNHCFKNGAQASGWAIADHLTVWLLSCFTRWHFWANVLGHFAHSNRPAFCEGKLR